MEDDIWDDFHNTNDYEQKLREREWNNLERAFVQAGYRETVSEEKEKWLQSGFNQGFSEGGVAGLRFGRVIGIISGLDMMYTHSKSLASKDINNEWVQAVSTLHEQLTDLSTQRNRTFSQEQESTMIEKLADLLRAFIERQLEFCLNVDESTREIVLTTLDSLLSGEDTWLLSELFFDAFPQLIKLVASHGSNQAWKVLMFIVGHSNAKEVFLLLLQCFEQYHANSSMVCRLVLLTKEVLPRLPLASRASFLDTAFETVLSLIPLPEPRPTDIQRTKEAQSNEDYTPYNHYEPYDTYLGPLVDMISPLLDTQDMSQEPVRNKRQKIIHYLISIMERLAYTSLEGHYADVSVQILQCIVKLGAVSYVVEYGISNVSEGNVSYVGLGCIFYLLHKGQPFSLPCVLSPQRKLELFLPYAVPLLEHPRTSLKCVELLQVMVEHTPQCIQLDPNTVADTPWYELVESMINFMVNCPIQDVRTRTYKAFGGYLSLFEDLARFHVLKVALMRCPYSAVTGLLLHRIKEETQTAHRQQLPSPFASSLVLDLVSSLATVGDLLNRADILLGVINYYRFLLILDYDKWNPQLAAIQKSFIEPLLRQIRVDLENHSRTPTEEEADNTRRLAKEHGLPEISDHEMEEAMIANKNTLLLLKDLAERLSELMNGSKPISWIKKATN